MQRVDEEPDSAGGVASRQFPKTAFRTSQQLYGGWKSGWYYPDNSGGHLPHRGSPLYARKHMADHPKQPLISPQAPTLLPSSDTGTVRQSHARAAAAGAAAAAVGIESALRTNRTRDTSQMAGGSPSKLV